jgi:hypothetical protein
MAYPWRKCGCLNRAIDALKFSIPRKVFSGDVADTDVYGGQFHGPLVRLLVNEDD